MCLEIVLDLDSYLPMVNSVIYFGFAMTSNLF